MENGKVAAYRWNRFGAAVLRASLYLVGMGFIVLGLTLLPIIGLFVGLGCFALAQCLWSPGRTKDLPVLIGHFDDRRLANARALPVAISSTSRKSGVAYDFNATTADAATVGVGPNSVHLLDGSGEQSSSSPRFGDVDEEGGLNFVGCFSPDQAGVTPEASERSGNG